MNTELKFHYEHERKFLVIVPELPPDLPAPRHYVQGYLQLDPYQIRVRIIDAQEACREVKMAGDLESDPEPLAVREAMELIRNKSVPGTTLIEKYRHRIPAGFDELHWEMDVFKGSNNGLIVVEIELPSLDHLLPPELLPTWLGPEVSNDPRFKNRNLAVRPFASWPLAERKAVWRRMACY